MAPRYDPFKPLPAGWDDGRKQPEDLSLPRWEVWMEGYAATGEHSPAHKVGEAHALTFGEACDKLCVNRNLYDAENLSVWGCSLYPTEKEARQSFG